MKVRYWILLTAVVAVALMSGPASAQPGYPICVELAHVGDDVTMTWRDEDGAIAADYEAVELYIAEIGLAEITPGDPGSATFPWDDALETSDFAQLVLQDDGGEETESRIYFAVPYEVLPERIDMGYDTPAEAIEAGGNCEEVEPPAPEVSARITGPHNADPGDSVVLTAVAEGFDEGTETYLWNDASTAATLDLGVVDAGDTGVYTCTVGGDAGGEAADPVEASFTLWVGVATPLAGGLGLGLLVGACALAGAVSIRRKK